MIRCFAQFKPRVTTPVSLHLAVTVSVLSAGTHAMAAQEEKGVAVDHLVLTAVEVTQIPDGVAVSDIAAAGGTIVAVALSAQGAHVFLFDTLASTPSLLPGLQDPIAVAFLAASSSSRALEVYDAGRSTIFSFESERVRRASPVRLPHRAEIARRAETGWYVGGSRTNNLWVLSWISDDQRLNSGADGSADVVASFESSDPTTRGFQISTVDNDVLVTTLRLPIQTRRLSPLGVLKMKFEEISEQDLSAGPEGLRDVAALPVIPLDVGFVQVVTDLASDHRFFVVFDALGQVVRISPVTAPIGLTRLNRERDRLIGLRRVNGQEIVQYAWRWDRPSP